MKKMSYIATVENATLMLTGKPLPEGVTAEMVLDRLAKLRTSLVKKNSGTRKKTPLQEQNEQLREQVIEILSDGIMRNVADLKEALNLPVETTPQRVAGILRPMIEDGTIISKEIKRKRFYTLSAAETDAE